MNIRPIREIDYPLLEDFLYLAIHQADPNNPIPGSVVDVPEVRNYISGFGTKKDDYGLVAEIEEKVVGIVWARVLSGNIKGYGYIDDETPEFAISVTAENRGQGIGKALMNAMIELLKQKSYKQCSLSVQKSNKAINLYKRLGFMTVKETDEDYIMIKKLTNEKPG